MITGVVTAQCSTDNAVTTCSIFSCDNFQVVILSRTSAQSSVFRYPIISYIIIQMSGKGNIKEFLERERRKSI